MMEVMLDGENFHLSWDLTSFLPMGIGALMQFAREPLGDFAAIKGHSL